MAISYIKNIHNPKWVKLIKYCELSGDSPDAVYAKRKRGIWLDGIHCKIAPDNKLWVNMEEIQKWVEQGIVIARE